MCIQMLLRRKTKAKVLGDNNQLNKQKHNEKCICQSLIYIDALFNKKLTKKHKTGCLISVTYSNFDHQLHPPPPFPEKGEIFN